MHCITEMARVVSHDLPSVFLPYTEGTFVSFYYEEGVENWLWWSRTVRLIVKKKSASVLFRSSYFCILTAIHSFDGKQTQFIIQTKILFTFFCLCCWSMFLFNSVIILGWSQIFSDLFLLQFFFFSCVCGVLLSVWMFMYIWIHMYRCMCSSVHIQVYMETWDWCCESSLLILFSISLTGMSAQSNPKG